MAPSIGLRRDARDDPLVSATFVLGRLPAPDERLSPLVERGVLALDLTSRVEGGLASSTAVSLVRDGPDGRRELASAVSTDPFGHVAIQADLGTDDARAALEAVLGGSTDLAIEMAVDATTEDDAAADVITVQVELGALWDVLDPVADDTRRFHRGDLANYLPALASAGAHRLVAGNGSPAQVAEAVARTATWILEPSVSPAGREAEHVLGPAWVLARQRPPTMSMTGRWSVTDLGPATTTSRTSVLLHELVPPAIRHDPPRFVHLVGVHGGELDAVLPVRTRAARSRARPGMQIATATTVASISTVLRPTAVSSPIRPQLVTAVLERPELTHVAELEVVLDRPERRPGPLVSDREDPYWPDRWHQSLAWYAPHYELLVPDPARSHEESPFRFELRPGVGHTADGRPSIDATVTVGLRRTMSGATAAAADAAGRSERREVAITGSSCHLTIPFRDERGEDRVETVTASSVARVGDVVTVTFRLADAWARLAYGALSTPGFQTRPARVVVSDAFEGWRPAQRIEIAGLTKRRALTSFADHLERDGREPDGRNGRPRPGGLAGIHATALATAHVQPAWTIRPELLDRVEAVRHTWSEFAVTRQVDVVVPCSRHGEVYREMTDDGSTAIGCRPALQLGETEHRTYERVEIASADGHATILRSLRSPGRFLVVPARYVIGRYEPDHPRGHAPTLLLHSTIDGDDPTNIRCVLAAALQPDMPRFRRDAIVAELGGHHPEPVLEWPLDAGPEPEVLLAVPGATDVDCVPTSTGFDVICTTDIAGFLGLRALLERDGLRGSVRLELPGGIVARSDLVVSLSAVTGPFDAGPLALRPAGDRLVVRNATGQRIALEGIAVDGVEVASSAEIVPPNGEISIPRPAADGELVPIYAVEMTAERLEELRAYVEDLELGVVFVAAVDPAVHGLVGLEVELSFDGRPAEPLVLTTDRREDERTFLMPLTAFADDPAVEFTVHAVATDGTRRSGPPTSWRVRSQGVVIAVGPPD